MFDKDDLLHVSLSSVAIVCALAGLLAFVPAWFVYKPGFPFWIVIFGSLFAGIFGLILSCVLFDNYFDKDE